MLTYDYLHLNSIEQLPNGNLLISARNTWGVYEIDKQTGRIIWSLGGKTRTSGSAPGPTSRGSTTPTSAGDTLTLFDDASTAHRRSTSPRPRCSG